MTIQAPSLVACAAAIAVCSADPRVNAQASLPKSDQLETRATVPRARQYDVKSRINGQTYRLQIALPPNADPDVSYPVLYVLDANVFFGTAVDAVALQAFTKAIIPVTVVGIGYPTEDLESWRRLRRFDMSAAPTIKPEERGQYGGGDAFLRVVEEELKPFVEARYRIDKSRQAIFGMSFGGEVALRGLFRNSISFTTYIIATPEILWNNSVVLSDEPAFAKRVTAGEVRAKLLLTSAGDELAANVKSVADLAARLVALNPDKLIVNRTVFEGEVHVTVGPASLSRGLRFAFAPEVVPLKDAG